jgi:hypothetical protein
MANTKEASKDNFRACCPKCECDTVIPLMGVWVSKSFSGNRLRMEWPSRGDSNEEFANVGCPQCGAVLRIHADGRIVPSGNQMFTGKKIGVKRDDGKRKSFSKV